MSVGARRLTVAYTPGQAVVDAVTVEVATNEWVGLIGPNGAGKSSLLRALAGLIPADGEIELDGTPIATIARRQLSQLVAFVAQEPVMPAGMTVTEYVLLGRTPYLPYLGSESRHDISTALSAMELLELRSRANRMLSDLSGGERQRVSLARALAQEPSILLLDEPTSALDIGHRQTALDLIGAIRAHRPVTIVSAMHDLTLAGQFSDRLVLLSEGRVVAEGDARSVLTEHNIGKYYDAHVRVVEIEDGIVVVPAPARSR